MATLFCSITGEAITLTKEINKSGEGTIWETNKNNYIAKIYHSPDIERLEKLKVMLAYPPDEPNSHLNHISFAWPKSLLQDSNGWVLGFLMPYIAGSQELISIYNPQRRLKLGLKVDWYFLHTVAYNVASIIHAIHSKGYVVGDIKPQNILVNNRALPSIIDTDSFQVRNPKNNKLYHCLVGSEGFTPAELLEQDLSTVKQTEIHDRFRLGVIIYLLLLAEQPFKGLWTGKGELPEPTELLRKGFWSHGKNSSIIPSPLTIPLNILHPELQRCFQLCFDDGHILPHRRPTAAEWKKAVITARTQLTNCNLIDNHIYSKSYGKCYWCERTANIQLDIFPGKIVASKPSQHQSKVFTATNTLSKNNQANTTLPKLNQNISPQSIKTSLIYSKKARACIDANQHIQAIQFYRLAIQYNPNNYILYYNRGNTYYYLKNYHNAIQDYEQALQLNPNHTKAANNLTVAKNMLLSPRQTLKKAKKQTQTKTKKQKRKRKK